MSLPRMILETRGNEGGIKHSIFETILSTRDSSRE